MKVLVTGHDGYIGTVLTPLLAAAGHEPVGLDTSLFANHAFGDLPDVPAREADIRDVTAEDLDGFDAVIHLAALSNDPLGDLAPAVTYAVNHHASVALARAAREAGVPRFLYSSSCSTYGAGDTARRSTRPRPSTPSRPTASRRCSPSATSPRSPPTASAPSSSATPPPTASPPACAATSWSTTSSPTPTPPARCGCSPTARPGARSPTSRTSPARSSPRSRRHGRHPQRGVQHRPRRGQPPDPRHRPDGRGRPSGAKVTLAPGASPDKRSYRVDFAKSARCSRPAWTVQRGIEQILAAYAEQQLTLEQFLSPRFQRIARLQELVEAGELDADLRRRVRA